MKKRWIEYADTWQPGPMSYWVHVETDGRPWHAASQFAPPLPGPVAGKGYARFFVEFDGCTFEFASLDELRVCISTLGQKLLPTTIHLCQQRGGGMGPNSHWLSRLPPRAKPWRYRQRAVAYLTKSLEFFRTEITRHGTAEERRHGTCNVSVSEPAQSTFYRGSDVMAENPYQSPSATAGRAEAVSPPAGMLRLYRWSRDAALFGTGGALRARCVADVQSRIEGSTIVLIELNRLVGKPRRAKPVGLIACPFYAKLRSPFVKTSVPRPPNNQS